MGFRISALVATAMAALAGLGPGARHAAVSTSGGAGLPQQLSMAQLAGQRVVYAYAGLEPPPSLLTAVRAGEAGGVILFSNNVASRAQLRNVVAELQRAALASPVHERLLILTDQEGGEVRRLPGAPILSERQIGESSSGVALARSAGAGAGRNLAGVGVNVNLAPVLDVYREPGDFIDQFARSYSSRPATAASLGGAFIRAQQSTGVAATAKHFPGLGAASTAQNTDLRPVTLNLGLGTLRTVDEAPYRAAVAAGVKLVMTSWAIYPALDAKRPAGLSPIVIQDELRGRLGFRGVTITDGIEAGAVRPFGSLARRGVLAAGAGSDLVLCAATNPAQNTPQDGLTVLHALTAAISDGQLGLASARQAAARILALRR
ncbi:MAG TPA: glycoside hydrolase family 3 N-terminal domain-containing protein [Solirubrobacteraceae bacterium]|nr:glycoside hydrolase family 3 N-terminal domain-containing protein [Solirubrobacteraceae bacterium]